MLRHALHTPIALALATLVAAPAAAQSTDTAAPAQPAYGWTVTPSLLFNTAWDDNALIRSSGSDTTPADLVNVVNPRIGADFKGRRGEFAGSYDGAFRLYRSLDTLNSYDQQGSVSGRRLVARHVTLFSGYQMFAAPTTELLEIVGIPFVRTGSRSQTLHGGVEAALSKHTSLSASYNFQQVHFDQTNLFNVSLLGGHSHGAQATVKHALSPRFTLTGVYDVQWATVGAIADAFNIYRAEGGVEYRLSDRMRVFGSGGVSHLAVSTFGAARTGPSWHAGLAREFEAGSVDVSYGRSFVPSYGFGGTEENEEVTGRVRVPLSRTLYSQSSASWRRNEPLTLGGLKLRTLAFQTSVGYLLAPWAAIEGFYDAASQEIARPGSKVGRQRLGAQIITTKPMRIR